MGFEQVSLRLPSSLLRRIEKLIPFLSEDKEFHHLGDAGRSSVIRVAMESGVKQMELRYGVYEIEIDVELPELGSVSDTVAKVSLGIPRWDDRPGPKNADGRWWFDVSINIRDEFKHSCKFTLTSPSYDIFARWDEDWHLLQSDKNSSTYRVPWMIVPHYEESRPWHRSILDAVKPFMVEQAIKVGKTKIQPRSQWGEEHPITPAQE